MTHKHRILVVEDDLGIRELLTARLKDADVTFATCQSEAYEQLRTSEFDLVLLDLRLPTKPGDMKATNQVGIDILRQIRTQGLTKRGSAMLLPVVVMTAYGSETLSADVLVGTGANDYIPKPFGAEGTLEHKIRVALAGEGALVPASNIVGSTIRIAFSTAQEVVCIETFEYSGALYGLLKVLGDLYVQDLQNLSSEENFTRLPGGRLADRLGITEEAMRRRILKFRREVSREFRDGLGRALGKNDIIENRRDWNGYRLNPRIVRVVAWDQMPRTSPEQ
ncbi:MAG: response regulator [Sandaracinaceae bacterium]